jgi:hypothetical protein
MMGAEERLLVRKGQEVELRIRDLKTIPVGSLAWGLNQGSYFTISIMIRWTYGSEGANVQRVKLQHIRMGIRCSNNGGWFARTLSWRHRSISPER